MLSIFACTSWPSICLLWWNIYLGLLPIFYLDYLFFYDIELHELFVYFADESFVHCFICKYFLPFWGLSFRLVYGFLCCAKPFKFHQVPFVYFCFNFYYSRRRVKKDLAVVYVKECFSNAFFLRALYCPVLHLGFKSIWSLYLCMVLGSVLISFFYM